MMKRVLMGCLVLAVAAVFFAGCNSQTAPEMDGTVTEATLPSAPSTPTPKPSVTPTPEPETTPAPTLSPEEIRFAEAEEAGEYYYAGLLDCDLTNAFRFSFFLSADRRYIHGVQIETKNSVGVSKSEGYDGDYPVSFGGRTSNIRLGEHLLYQLDFVDSGRVRVGMEYGFYGEYAETSTVENNVYGDVLAENAPDSPLPEDPATLDYTATVFDESKLKNWNDDLPGGVSGFKPAHPVPKHYIVCVEPVTDPETGRESSEFTDAVLRITGNLSDGQLTLTDDPDLATYAFVIRFRYEYVNSFHWSDGSTDPRYNGIASAELINLTNGESLAMNEILEDAPFKVGDTVSRVRLDAAKGKPMYATPAFISDRDFDGYWDFVTYEIPPLDWRSRL